ncbi:MAG: acyl-CoA dehydrogenase family protein [Chloroflexi bacterium]|nr:acyl-CoA dehydrogenase family protein [Chloroflexota bacterium]
MDFQFTPEQETFRRELADFLLTELKNYLIADYTWGDCYDPAFTRRAGEKGYIGLAWPKRLWGGGRSMVDLHICTEEMTYRGAPMMGHWIAERLVAPAVIACGTPEQQALVLPPIARGEIACCVGLAEPQTGCDIGGAETRAVEKDGYFEVNGQKMFITGGQWCRYCLLLARTGTPESRHRGLSLLLVDMRSPGITVNRLACLYGDYPFSHIFFDNVRVPGTMLVGEKNGGFKITTTFMNHDRSSVELIGICRRLIDALVRYCQDTGAGRDARVRQRLAGLATETEVGKWICYRAAWLLDRGRPMDVESSIAKVYASDLMQRIANEALRICRLRGIAVAGRTGALNVEWLQKLYMNCLARTIGGGSDEMMRNVVAQWGLGLLK